MGDLATVFRLIDEANAADPALEADEAGNARPAALLYGERMSAALDGFQPDAPETLRIACRAQHLERWKLPRAEYPMTKPGYHAWRNEQKRRHGVRAGDRVWVSGMVGATPYTLSASTTSASSSTARTTRLASSATRSA